MKVMPRVVGQPLDAAEAAAKQAGVKLTFKHGAQEGYRIEAGDHDEWTVVTSSLAEGLPAKAGQSIAVTVLFPDEAKWYLSHRTMPNMLGQDAPSSGSIEGPFSGLPNDRLVVLCAKGTESWTDTEPSFSGPYGPNTPMTAAELAPVKGLKECISGGTVTATYPTPGQSIRPGRNIYFIVKGTGEKEPITNDSAPGSSPGGSGGGGSVDWPNHLPGHRHRSHWHW
ncbi:hypothetical protein [Dermacoccus sp. PE3]|uniref:hypothetical protein n=1 Tax=Dermacoccus sp. PE3 TaxID=1641401 RepID=UPI0012E0A8D7|nr:hypothetical protein [Dermacoccus sp. PE3]